MGLTAELYTFSLTVRSFSPDQSRISASNAQKRQRQHNWHAEGREIICFYAPHSRTSSNRSLAAFDYCRSLGPT